MPKPVKGQPSPVKGRSFKPEPLSPEEVSALIGACSLRAPTGIRDHALIMMLYLSGLRVSEALALRPFDVDFRHHKPRLLSTKASEAQTRVPLVGGRRADAVDRDQEGTGIKGGPLFCTLGRRSWRRRGVIAGGFNGGLGGLGRSAGSLLPFRSGFASLSPASGTFFSATMTYVVAICRAFESPNFWCWHHFVTWPVGAAVGSVNPAISDG